MSNGPGRIDRVLGYLGLLLIGTLGWAADHVHVGPTVARETAHPSTVHASRRAHA